MSVSPYHAGDDFSRWLLSELYDAYIAARKAKRRTVDEQNFELYAMENLVALRNQILARKYKPSRGIAFVTRKPVIREIFAAPFVDRIVHHLLYNIVYEWWDARFIYDSYSCRLGKGTLMGIQRTDLHMRQASDNYTRETYVVKLDIQGYFTSLPREKLYERVLWGLDHQFPEHGKIYELARYLWHEVIFDDPVEGVVKKGCPKDWEDLPRSKSLFCQKPGRGIVIGNLSSQLLSNIYLDQLDRYMKRDLHYRYYGRYVDDFVFFVTRDQLEQALIDVHKIEAFLRDELELTLHPRKRYIQNIEHGVDFLGAKIYPYRIVASTRLKRNFRQAAREVVRGERSPDTIISYMGHLKYMKNKQLTKHIFSDVGWEYKY